MSQRAIITTPANTHRQRGFKAGYQGKPPVPPDPPASEHERDLYLSGYRIGRRERAKETKPT